MKRVNRLFVRIHRILGTVLSVLFLVWFLTGMVMMYHTYPSLTQQHRMEHAETLECPIACPQELSSPSSVTFERIAGRNICIVNTDEGEHLFDVGNNGKEITRFTEEELMQIASRWTATAPTLLDTLNEIDVWLIGCMPFKEYPVYHYALNDGRDSELYLSSRTGRALQLTDSKSRFWAWIGAIPHWIYIKQLRATGRQPWTDVVLWLSGFGIAMTLAGIVIAIRSMLLARRNGKYSPYAKPLFRYHHLFGLFFGLFVLTWIFSGFMSLADAPQLFWPTHGNHNARDVYSPNLHLSHFRLSLSDVVNSDEVKRVELMEMGGQPFYHVFNSSGDYLVDAGSTMVQRKELNTAQCRSIVQYALQSYNSVMAAMLTGYDNYYISQKRPLPLPVCRVSVDDADGSTYYINPKNGDCRYYNHNRRAGKWMYTGLHAFNTPFFVARPWLRKSVLWLLLLGGTVVSLTGLLLAINRLKKIIINKRKS